MNIRTIIVPLPQHSDVMNHYNIKLPDNIKMMSTSTYQDKDGIPLLAITFIV